MKNARFYLCAGLALVAAFAAVAAMPYVTDVSLAAGAGSREATVTYVLHGAPAVVTFDIQTNATPGGAATWISIGGSHLSCVSPDSAAFREVEAEGAHTIRWSANDETCNFNLDGSNARAVVTAWALDDTPDWLTVELCNLTGSTALVRQFRYYPSEDFLPGGLVSNREYRSSMLALRRIHARGVPWTRGSVMEASREVREMSHAVTLTNDYYIAAFPITQSQYYILMGSNPAFFVNEAYKAMRPVEQVHWVSATNFCRAASARTGLDFTLPSESQWEFACRAGHGEGFWGDGTRILDTWHCPNVQGRYAGNGGYPKAGDENDGNTATNQWTAANGTAECGTYKPNSWGLYDMCGNVTEWCIDWYTFDPTAYAGAPVDVMDPNDANRRSCRGGTFEMGSTWWLRPAHRDFSAYNSAWRTRGLRPICRAGLK